MGVEAELERGEGERKGGKTGEREGSTFVSRRVKQL